LGRDVQHGPGGLVPSKKLCCYPLPRLKATSHGTAAQPDPQPTSQRRGEALLLLTTSVSSYWLPGLDLAPVPTLPTFLMHISLTEIP